MGPIFTGYWAFGGQEIINGPRTLAYLQHLQPTLSVGSACCPCDTLAEALGDAPYGTPAQDDAEWFNPYAPESGGFYGLIPLAMEGFEDSTWQVPIVDLTGDGSVAGRGRRGGRDLRFRVLAVAESEKAMSRGLAWLRDALGGEGCASGDCGGAQGCYLTDCPGCCAPDAPQAPETVDHLDYRPLTTAAGAAQAATDWTATAVPTALRTDGKSYALWSGSGVRLERTMHGLVPGVVYRIALDWGSNTGSGTTEIKVTIPGAAELLARRTADVSFKMTPHPDQGVALWEFIATECDHRVVIESTGDLAIGLWDVTMSALDAVPYSAQPSYYVDDATAWTSPLLSDPTFHVTQPTAGHWLFGAAASTPVPVGVAEVRAQVTGLRANQRYQVAVLATSDHNAAARAATVQAYDGDGQVLATADLPGTVLTGGLHGGWVTLDIQPTRRVIYLSVSNATGFNVTDAAPYAISIQSVHVEDWTPQVVTPDPVDDLRRYLRDVVLTSGPSVTTVYPSYTAVMKEVEWTMRANVPDPLGEDILVTETLGSGRWVVPEVACSLGEAVRTNWLPNPSGEYGTTGWPAATGFTVTNPTSTTARSGARVIRVTQTATTGGNRTITLATVPVVAGTPWTLTLPSRTSVQGRTIRATFAWMKGAFQVGSQVANLVTTDVVSDWQTLLLAGTAPPGATSLVVTLTLVSPGAWALNEWTEFDAAMLEQTYGQRAYFDGDSLYGTWAGTPGNSASTYQRTSNVLVFDPDCPPTPDPPRPPDIVNVCLTTPDTWIRYVLDIPALATAKSPRSAPTVTLTTGTTEARGVRVRIYANPFSQSFKDIDPCSYCGEFLVSYMPPNSSLTVDGADRTASIVTPQGETSALPLLFGSDGGPVTWPTLGCAMPYLLALDVDAAEAPLIGASLSVTPLY